MQGNEKPQKPDVIPELSDRLRPVSLANLSVEISKPSQTYTYGKYGPIHVDDQSHVYI